MSVRISLLLLVAFFSCKQKGNTGSHQQGDIRKDTVLVKSQDTLTGFNKDYMSKSYSYYWVAGKDTADLGISAYQRKEDSSLHLVARHQKAVLFSNMVHQLQQAVPVIQEDFDWSRLESFFFKTTVYYPDLADTLSSAYQQQFGTKTISYERLSRFLLQSSLSKQLNLFLQPYHKKVADYNIEKFHLLEKSSYPYTLPDMDFSAYPPFTLHGMGVYVTITSL